MSSIRTKIAETISSIAPDVEEKIIEAFVNREVNKRSDAVVNALDLLSRAENDLRKIKPDLIALDGDGKELSATFSKAKYEELKKSKEAIVKINKAIGNALDNSDYSLVYDLISSKDKGQG
jgi:hypothetical protein